MGLLLLSVAAAALAGPEATPQHPGITGDAVVAALAPELNPAALRELIQQLPPAGASAISDFERPFLTKWAEARDAEASGDLKRAFDLYSKAVELPRWETPSGAPLLDRARVSRKLQLLRSAPPPGADPCELTIWPSSTVEYSLSVADDLLGYIAYVEADFSNPQWEVPPAAVKEDFTRRDLALKALQLVIAEYATMPREDVSTALQGGTRCH